MFPNLEVSLRLYKHVKIIMFCQFHMMQGLQFLRCLWHSYDGFLFIFEIKMMKFCISCEYVIYTKSWSFKWHFVHWILYRTEIVKNLVLFQEKYVSTNLLNKYCRRLVFDLYCSEIKTGQILCVILLSD